MLNKFFGSFAQSAALLEAQASSFAAKYRVEVKVPDEPADVSYVIFSAGKEVLESAESGEILRVLVDPGYHRIVAVERALVGMPGQSARGIVLFSGTVDGDVSLPSSVRSSVLFRS